MGVLKPLILCIPGQNLFRLANNGCPETYSLQSCSTPFKVMQETVVKLFSRFLIALYFCTVSLAALPGCAPNTPLVLGPYQPKQVPSGWVADFSYTESLSSYLKTQASVAKSRSKKPLIYVFDDRYGPCMLFRRRADYKGIQVLFDDKHVIMLNHNYIHWLVRSYDEIESSGLDQIGILVRIDDSGFPLRPIISHFVEHSNGRADQLHYLKHTFERIYSND